MRTTVTLDDDVEQLIRERMASRGVGFKRALNDAVRAGVHQEVREPFVQRTFDMGVPKVDVTKALQLSAEIADAHLVEGLRRP